MFTFEKPYAYLSYLKFRLDRFFHFCDASLFLYSILRHYKQTDWDFPGSQLVKTLPSNAGSMGLIPGQGAKTPYALLPKK